MPYRRRHRKPGREARRPVDGPLHGVRRWHTFVYVGPVSFFIAYTDYGAILVYAPRSASQTELHVTWLVRADARQGVDYELDRVTWLWRVTNDADKRIIEQNQLGVASRFYQPGPYVLPIENSSRRFTEWYLHDLGLKR